MNRMLALLPIACVAAPCVAQAPAPDSWVLLAAPEEGVDLRCQLERVEGGWQLQFKNAGTSALHFAFRLRGVQPPGDAVRNGRVHLEPGAVAAPFLPWTGDGPAVLPEVALTAVRVGEDEGPFWRE